MKRIISVILCLSFFLLSGCSGENPSTDSTPSVNSDIQSVTPYKTVIMRETGSTKISTALDTVYDTVYSQALSFAKSSGEDALTEAQTTKENAVTSIIAEAVKGAKTFICIGSGLSDAVLTCAQSYKNLNFVLFDGEIDDNELPQNVLQFSYTFDEAGFVMGYSLVRSGIKNIGFAMDEDSFYVRQILKGIKAGAGYAANLINNPAPTPPVPTPESSSSDATSSAVISSEQSQPATNKTPVRITVEKYDLSVLGKEGFVSALDTRKAQGNMRIVCIGSSVATITAAHTGGFYILTDSKLEYSRKHAEFAMAGTVDISAELDMINTAGEGWATTYGKRTLKLSIADGNIAFSVFRLSNVYFSDATAYLAANKNYLALDEMEKGYGYVTETAFEPS